MKCDTTIFGFKIFNMFFFAGIIIVELWAEELMVDDK